MDDYKLQPGDVVRVNGYWIGTVERRFVRDNFAWVRVFRDGDTDDVRIVLEHRCELVTE